MVDRLAHDHDRVSAERSEDGFAGEAASGILADGNRGRERDRCAPARDDAIGSPLSVYRMSTARITTSSTVVVFHWMSSPAI